MIVHHAKQILILILSMEKYEQFDWIERNVYFPCFLREDVKYRK